jgi:thymidylate kinase
MKIVPVYVWDKLPIIAEKDRLIARSEEPLLRNVIEQRGIKLRRPQEKKSNLLERILVTSRVLIIEGISGSGKDTFQTYLKDKVKGRHVYDYSEGELMHSWKHIPIQGILKLRFKFIKLFMEHVKDIVNRDENAVFILNRFHLSTYVSTIIREPAFKRQYDEIVNILRTLPVHVFILQLDEHEIEKRSLHAERSSTWQKYQQQRVKGDGFRDRVERYIWQQKLILEAAKTQKIPYSIIKFSSSPPQIKAGLSSVGKSQSIVRSDINAAHPKITPKESRSFSKLVRR